MQTKEGKKVPNLLWLSFMFHNDPEAAAYHVIPNADTVKQFGLV